MHLSNLFDNQTECCYGNNMKTLELKVARIGNSRGVRIPADTLLRYGISDGVMMDEREDGILLRPRDGVGRKLSLEETARAIARSTEDWTYLDTASADGLDGLPWEDVAEGPQNYGGNRQ